MKWNAATVRVAADEVAPDAPAVVVDADGERAYPSLSDAASSDPALVVTPDTVVERVGGLPPGEAPDECFFEGLAARFDPVAWSDTYYDSCYGEGNWLVVVDGEQVPFDLTWFEPSSVPDERAPAGSLVVLENGGYSMSTGPIGLSVDIDAAGAVWARCWGTDTWYLGPVGDADLLAEAQRGLTALFSDGVMDLVCVSSDLLSVEQLRGIVADLLDGISYELPADAAVEGPGYATTVGELFPDRFPEGTGSDHHEQEGGSE